MNTTDDQRLKSLFELHILDTENEERFDRFVRIAAVGLNFPIAKISFVDQHRQWIKSSVGVSIKQIPRDQSLCEVVIRTQKFVVSSNITNDRRFAVTNQIVSYAGYPLFSPDKQCIGVFSVADTIERTLSSNDIKLFTDIGSAIQHELDTYTLAIVDPLTDLLNRRGFEYVGRSVFENVRRQQQSATLLFFDLDGFKQINDTFGHEVGDLALKQFSAVLKQTFRATDIISRLSGDEFVVFIVGGDSGNIQSIIDRFYSSLEQFNMTNDLYKINTSVGVTFYDGSVHKSLNDMLTSADYNMYLHKQRSRS